MQAGGRGEKGAALTGVGGQFWSHTNARGVMHLQLNREHATKANARVFRAPATGLEYVESVLLLHGTNRYSCVPLIGPKVSLL